MTAKTLTERARTEVRPSAAPGSRILGHPVAFLVTAAILLALFGWTFLSNTDRVAPTKDPAYYTWRTETLISEDPVTLLEVEGAYDMFAGGYRVSASVIGGFLRDIPGISSLKMTIFLMVLVPVLTALLLAGFAYRHRRDPLLFHSVALGVGSLYLTPPFVGYLDNVLCLLFLAAAIWFIGPARTTWPGRIGLFLFLLATGFTHPTTLVIFCLTLGAISTARLIFRGFDLRSIIRDDLPMLLSAFGAAVATLALWGVGIWGKSASLTEAALPPPYDSEFFVDRMVSWIANPAEGGFVLLRGPMTPLLNGILFAVGLVGLLIAGRRWVEDELATVSVVWLAPLAGLFGFLGGLTYPYYRFFNTTLAWVLLVGIGGWILIRWLSNRFAASAPLATIVGAVIVAAVFGLNFARGFDSSGWNNPEKSWLSSDERTDLNALREGLAGDDRPVVFVIDSAEQSFQVWGEAKLAGNTSRYGLPPGQIDRGYLYLGSLQNFLERQPTYVEGKPQPTEECSAAELGENTYNCLSPALLEDAQAGIEDSGKPPVVVVASIFNSGGANVELLENKDGVGAVLAGPVVGADVWALDDGEITILAGEDPPEEGSGEDEAGLLHLLRVLAGLALLLTPGWLALRYFLPDATFAEALAMVPGLSIAMLTIVGIGVLAVARTELSGVIAWIALILSAGLGALAAARWGPGLPLYRRSL
ncbi:MAG: hypothetical protein M3280_05820 [Actinomycetota bacterium]|nr:hypothetical protein [Actinomycetota bacterium]